MDLRGRERKDGDGVTKREEEKCEKAKERKGKGGDETYDQCFAGRWPLSCHPRLVAGFHCRVVLSWGCPFSFFFCWVEEWLRARG